MKTRIIKEFLKYTMLGTYSAELKHTANGLAIALDILEVDVETLAWLEQKAKTWLEENCPGEMEKCILGCDKCLEWIEGGKYA